MASDKNVGPVMVPPTEERVRIAQYLLQCAKDGNISELSRTINETAISIQLQDSDGYTPLILATRYGQVAMVKELLLMKADVTCQTKNGKNVLFFVENPLIGDMLLNDQRLNLEHRSDHGETPLIIAAFLRSSDVVDWFLKNGADVRAVSKNGVTPLMAAVMGGRLDNVKVILPYCDKALVNARDSEGNTALLLAIVGEANNHDIMRTLLAAGADPYVGNHVNESPFHFTQRQDALLEFFCPYLTPSDRKVAEVQIEKMNVKKRAAEQAEQRKRHKNRKKKGKKASRKQQLAAASMRKGSKSATPSSKSNGGANSSVHQSQCPCAACALKRGDIDDDEAISRIEGEFQHGNTSSSKSLVTVPNSKSIAVSSPAAAAPNVPMLVSMSDTEVAFTSPKDGTVTPMKKSDVGKHMAKLMKDPSVKQVMIIEPLEDHLERERARAEAKARSKKIPHQVCGVRAQALRQGKTVNCRCLRCLREEAEKLRSLRNKQTSQALDEQPMSSSSPSSSSTSKNTKNRNHTRSALKQRLAQKLAQKQEEKKLLDKRRQIERRVDAEKHHRKQMRMIERLQEEQQRIPTDDRVVSDDWIARQMQEKVRLKILLEQEQRRQSTFIVGEVDDTDQEDELSDEQLSSAVCDGLDEMNAVVETIVDAQRKLKEVEEARKRKEAEEAERKRKQEEEAEKKRKQEEEAERKRKEEEEAEKKRKQEEEAERKRKQEEAERKRKQEEEAERKRKQEEEAERKRRQEEEAERKRKQEEEAERKRKQEEEAEKKRKQEEEAERKRKQEAAEKKRKQEEEAEKKRKQEEEAESARKLQQEAERKRRQQEEAERRRKVREAERKRKQKEEVERKRKEEAERKRKRQEEAERKRKQEKEEAERKRKQQEEEEAERKRKQEEEARLMQEREMEQRQKEEGERKQTAAGEGNARVYTETVRLLKSESRVNDENVFTPTNDAQGVGVDEVESSGYFSKQRHRYEAAPHSPFALQLNNNSLEPFSLDGDMAHKSNASKMLHAGSQLQSDELLWAPPPPQMPPQRNYGFGFHHQHQESPGFYDQSQQWDGMPPGAGNHFPPMKDGQVWQQSVMGGQLSPWNDGAVNTNPSPDETAGVSNSDDNDDIQPTVVSVVVNALAPPPQPQPAQLPPNPQLQWLSRHDMRNAPLPYARMVGQSFPSSGHAQVVDPTTTSECLCEKSRKMDVLSSMLSQLDPRVDDLGLDPSHFLTNDLTSMSPSQLTVIETVLSRILSEVRDAKLMRANQHALDLEQQVRELHSDMHRLRSMYLHATPQGSEELSSFTSLQASPNFADSHPVNHE